MLDGIVAGLQQLVGLLEEDVDFGGAEDGVGGLAVLFEIDGDAGGFLAVVADLDLGDLVGVDAYLDPELGAGGEVDGVVVAAPELGDKPKGREEECKGTEAAVAGSRRRIHTLVLDADKPPSTRCMSRRDS